MPAICRMKSGLEKKMFEKDAESAAGALPKNILNGFVKKINSVPCLTLDMSWPAVRRSLLVVAVVARVLKRL